MPEIHAKECPKTSAGAPTCSTRVEQARYEAIGSAPPCRAWKQNLRRRRLEEQCRIKGYARNQHAARKGNLAEVHAPDGARRR